MKIEVIYKLTWFLAFSCPPEREANDSHHKELSLCSVKCVHVGGTEATHGPNLCLFFPLGGKNIGAFSSVGGSKTTYTHIREYTGITFKALVFAVLMVTPGDSHHLLMHSVNAEKGYCWRRGQQQCWRMFVSWRLLPRRLSVMCGLFCCFGEHKFEWVCCQRKGWNYSEGRLNRQVLPFHSVHSSLLLFDHISLPLPPKWVWCCRSGLIEQPCSLWRTAGFLECLSSWNITN